MVEIVAHNPLWTDDSRAERKAIRSAMGPHLITLHHIGSTSIPGIHAKPVIDMLAVAPSVEALDAAAPALVRLGYEAMGEYGIEGRRYFRKDDAAGRRTHHLHSFAADSPDIERHLAFRDFLRAHPDIAERYSALKQQLVTGSVDYIEGKAPFVLATQADAMVWYRAQPGSY
ncbi:GrpB family protein [Blastomonas sp.]|uniref:GrpB family protein n=1 Tax=Blastomonas sp. TaxID=1909299 RepID=UPI0026307753|nr:GrpB family protein [Blastomonas sp.]MDM7956866.1 GrpB family protein [Blastomonas sp.]